MVDRDLPDFPAVDVVLVEVPIVPTESEVICRCHDPRRADGVVRSDVRDDRNFAREADVREQELTEQRRKRTLEDPEANRVEEQLVAAICVLLPSGKFIVDGQ